MVAIDTHPQFKLVYFDNGRLHLISAWSSIQTATEELHFDIHGNIIEHCLYNNRGYKIYHFKNNTDQERLIVAIPYSAILIPSNLLCSQYGTIMGEPDDW